MDNNGKGNYADGDIALFGLTGRIKGSGSIFETSDEKLAQEKGIYNKGDKYGQRLIVFGKGMVFKKVEETLRGMAAGESKIVELSPEDAFGPRNNSLIRVTPIKELRERGIDPAPNTYLNLDNRLVRVVSVSSGRVVIDFNHPLAGAEVSYELKLETTVSEQTEKIVAFAKHYGIDCDAAVAEGKASITVKKLDNEIAYHGRKKSLVDALFVLFDCNKVAFSEEFERPANMEPSRLSLQKRDPSGREKV